MLDPTSVEVLFGRLAAAAPEESLPRRRTRQLDVKIRRTAFQSLVSCMLSAQSRDAMTARASAALFAVAGTPEAIAALSEERIAGLIRDCGLYRVKARNLKRMVAELAARFGGVVPATRAELMSLPGVGRKTADIVLRFVFDQPTVAVDTHVFRVARRLGLAQGRSEAQLAAMLETRVPEPFKMGAHLWLLNHGKRVCRARRPRCEACGLADLCERNGMPPSHRGGVAPEGAIG
jgi:endonuclease-3